MIGEGAALHVAIVIVNWNRRDDTLACLASLRNLRWERWSAIVVDNGSSDGTPAAVRELYPEAEVIECGENLGFAGGNNVGVRRALESDADYVFLLNNDTIVEPGLLEALVGEARKRPDVGALCPLIYYDESRDLIWYAGAMFDPRRGRNRRHFGYRERDSGRYNEVREITHATGAAMLVPRRVVEEVGLLDPELFLQVEDVDWSLRISAAGYRILFVPSGRVWHRVSVSSGGEHVPCTAYYVTRNTLEVARRHAPLTGLPALRRELTTLVVQIGHTRRARRPLANARAVVEGWRDFRAGRLGPRPARDQGRPASHAATNGSLAHGS